VTALKLLCQGLFEFLFKIVGPHAGGGAILDLSTSERKLPRPAAPLWHNEGPAFRRRPEPSL